MKPFIQDDRGVIYVSVIFISLIVLMMSTSLLHMLISNNMIINSNNDNYRAGYIIESALELKIGEITELCNKTAENYLTDLQTYNMGYIVSIDGHIFCNSPVFYNYVIDLVSDIEALNESVANPFEEYKGEHSYKVDIKYDPNENLIDITAMGEYRQARKFIRVKLELPAITGEDTDEYGLPTMIISPAKVIQYYQTFDKIDF